MNRTPPAFQPCTLCKRIAALSGQEITCPAWQEESQTLQSLQENTPYSQWQTPRELGRIYGYSSKHVLRLVQMNKLPAVNLNGRWMVLRCAFHLYLTTKGDHVNHFDNSADDVEDDLLEDDTSPDDP